MYVKLEWRYTSLLITHLNVTNIETVKFYSLFAETMVLSRELSLSQVEKITCQIKKESIKDPSGRLVEIEIFGHGALIYDRLR